MGGRSSANTSISSYCKCLIPDCFGICIYFLLHRMKECEIGKETTTYDFKINIYKYSMRAKFEILLVVNFKSKAQLHRR